MISKITKQNFCHGNQSILINKGALGLVDLLILNELNVMSILNSKPQQNLCIS